MRFYQSILWHGLLDPLDNRTMICRPALNPSYTALNVTRSGDTLSTKGQARATSVNGSQWGMMGMHSCINVFPFNPSFFFTKRNSSGGQTSGSKISFNFVGVLKILVKYGVGANSQRVGSPRRESPRSVPEISPFSADLSGRNHSVQTVDTSGIYSNINSL